jgi:hypothetical protein
LYEVNIIIDLIDCLSDIMRKYERR